MIYRKLRMEDLPDMEKLHSVVYFFKHDPEKPSEMPWLDEIRIDAARGAFTEDGKLSAVIQLIPFKAYLDGTVVGSPGIAGVATLLEHRRGGLVKKLMKNAMEEMYENGDVMSYLYPFSHDYYRKFGYSQGSYAEEINIDIDKLKKSGCDGYTRQYFPGDGYDDLKTVYNHFAKSFNCCVVRDKWRWKRLFSTDPYKENTFVYIRYNNADEPVAYIKFEAKQKGIYTHDMHVYEAAWVGIEGISGLLAIINSYEGNLEKLKLPVPPGFPVELIVKDVWDLTLKRDHTGMNRIVNAKKALEIMKKPMGNGKAVIGMNDDFAPWNSGNWLVEWEDGQSRVSKTEKDPDIICRAPEFSQLVTGYFPLETMKITDGIEILYNESTLKELFTEKPCFIWDRF
jgi:predicted acetyltransferase